MARICGTEAEIADESQLWKPIGLLLADLRVLRDEPPLCRPNVRALFQKSGRVAYCNRLRQCRQRAGTGQFGIERARFASGENGQLVQRLCNLCIERNNRGACVLDLSPNSLDVELRGDALRAALLSEGQYLLFELRRLTNQLDALLLVPQVDIGLRNFG